MASAQQFNLKWNNHTNNMLQVFMEHLNSENLVDVTLACQGQFLKAHKMILSACSPYFQEIFRQHEVHHPVIIVNGMRFIDIKMIVEFMYKGEIKVLETELDDVLAAAEALQVKGLSNVRNKYEKGDIQCADSQAQPIVQNSEERKDKSPLRRKKSRRSCSPMSDKLSSEDPLEESPETLNGLQENGYVRNSSISEAAAPKGFVNPTVNDCTDDDLPTTIKVEPPDIRDIDEDQSGWESPKLVIDLPEMESPRANSVQGRSPRGKSSPAMSSPEYNKSHSLMDFASTSSTSQDVNLVLYPLGSPRSKTVPPWLSKRTSKIPRPPNAFMIFANEWRRKLAFQFPTESNKEISVRLGIMWKSLAPASKEGYYSASRLADEEHKRKYPGYYYSPKEARLRKSLKTNLAAARKETKSIEALQLVKLKHDLAMLRRRSENPESLRFIKGHGKDLLPKRRVGRPRKNVNEVILHEEPENSLPQDETEMETLDNEPCKLEVFENEIAEVGFMDNASNNNEVEILEKDSA